MKKNLERQRQLRDQKRARLEKLMADVQVLEQAVQEEENAAIIATVRKFELSPEELALALEELRHNVVAPSLEAKAKQDKEQMEEEETDEEAGAHAIRKLLKRKVHFTAVLTLNDLMAFGAIRELNKKGLRVPDDISVIGCDNLEIGRYFVPSISTLDVSSFEMGKYLMNTLIARIEKKPEPHKVVASSYIERESVGICRK